MSVLEPVQTRDRVLLLDILRGFALFGILLVNFGDAIGSRLPRLDLLVSHGLEMLAEDSLYPLFSFLFGVGFAVQLTRSGERGIGIVHVYLRRLLALFIIGTVHAVLIWEGDVLTLYAMLGVLLIPLYRLGPRGLLVAALVLAAFQFEAPRLTRARDAWTDTPVRRQIREAEAELRSEQRDVLGNVELRGAGSWPDKVADRWQVYGREIRTATPLSLLRNDILLLFVLGLWAGRSRFFQEARQRRTVLTVVAVVGAVAAIAGDVLTRMSWDGGSEADRAIWMAANCGVTAFYIGVIGLMVTRRTGAPAVLTMLAPVGRMGLTNYLLQSIVMTQALRASGLGATLTLVACCGFFFLVQVPISHWWLARFQFGPAEWLWRSLTYGGAQPMRRTGPAAIPAPLPG